MEAMTICVFNKFGFCKYGVTCRKKHEDLKCENSRCEIFDCNKRHPKECKYFREFKRCKYNEYCRYEHKISNEVNKDLVFKYGKLEDRILSLEKVLENVEKNFKMVNDKLLEKEQVFQEINEFVITMSVPKNASSSLVNAPPPTDFMNNIMENPN